MSVSKLMGTKLKSSIARSDFLRRGIPARYVEMQKSIHSRRIAIAVINLGRDIS